MAKNSTGRPQLHVTSLNTISFCGIAFERSYMKGEKIPPSAYAIVGRSVDHSVNKNLGHKMETGGKLLPVEQVKEEAAASVSAEIEMGGIWLSEAEDIEKGLKKVKGEAIDKAVRLSELHANTLAPVIEPEFIQRKFTLELPNYPLDIVGTMDIQEKKIFEEKTKRVIRDTKTKRSMPSEDAAAKSLQLTGYALAMRVLDGYMPDEVTLDFLVDAKTPKQVVRTSTRTPLDFEMFLRRVEAAVRVIETGAYLPASANDPLCSAKWCGYWSTCDYAQKNPESVYLG